MSMCNMNHAAQNMLETSRETKQISCVRCFDAHKYVKLPAPDTTMLEHCRARGSFLHLMGWRGGGLCMLKQVFRPKAAFPQAVGRRRSARAKGRRTTPAVEDVSPGNPSPHHLHPDRPHIAAFCRPPEESQHQPKLVPEIRECARREMVGLCPGYKWMGGDWGCDSSRLAQRSAEDWAAVSPS